MIILKLQFATSKPIEGSGGRRYLPYVYAEQGISMLSAVLRSDIAIMVSIGIMNAFVEMRHYIKLKKYSSYQGEISPSVENIINRDFHADRPNEKWLTKMMCSCKTMCYNDKYGKFSES